MRNFRDYDEALTAPLHGFKDAADYYRRASSRPLLKQIEVPSIIVHARDDPFMDKSGIPATRELSSACTARVSPYGGHVAFLQRNAAGTLESAFESNLAALMVEWL